MNRLPFACLVVILFCGQPFRGQAAEPRGFTQTEPEIIAIHGRVVKVRVPAGFDRVTLQVHTARQLRSSSASHREWKTVGVNYPRKASTTIEFRLDRLTPRRLLRVFGTREDVLSGDLLTGITSFLPETPTIVPQANGTLVTFENGGAITNSFGAPSAAVSSAVAVTEIRTVAEADIWKVEGDRLYFFNERRGLQVFDLSNPDDPALLGTLRMPAMGEDMYLLDAEHVVLLKKSWNWYWWDADWAGGGGVVATNGETLSLSADSASISAAQLTIAPQRQTSRGHEIVIADVTDGKPRVVGRVEFEGTVRESRMVGKVLYLATDTYRPAVEGGQAQWGLEVTSFDLHDPTRPIKRASIHLGGWANAVSATDHTFLIAKWGARGGTAIDILDISDPNGAMTRGGSVSVVGSVADKFKLHEDRGVLTVVSQKWRERTRQEIDDLLNLPANVRPPDYVTASPVGITAVNTFSLANPAAPVVLGSLDLALDETLHATRFDGDRLYVITAQHRVWIHATYIWDPLWIVDLADPAQPKVLGELEMPGFSTYIEPLDDRLVTIGLLDGKPTVSLFDISDAAHPAELSRVALGGGYWTNSEAVWNEKAFSVLPEENLILMPLSNWDSWSSTTAGVQLLDLYRDRVVKRGLLQQPLAPRRATVHRDRIIAISPKTLLAIDATDRDVPRVTADVEIAWQVDRVFAIGEHVVQLGSEWRRGNEYDLTLTVSPAKSPDESLSTLFFGGASFIDATLRDDVLYLVQMTVGESQWDYNAGVYREVSPDRVKLSAVDLSRLPRLALLGSVTAEVSHPDRSWYSWGASVRSLWINENTLGFVAGGGRTLIAPCWHDPAPYDTYKAVWIPNPDAPSVDEAAIDAGSEADVTVTQIYIGKSPGHYEYEKTGTIDPPGYWWPSNVFSQTQRVFAFNVRDPARLRFASHFEIGGDQPWDVAPPVAVDGAIFASYQYLGTLLTSAEFQAFAAANASGPGALAENRPTRTNRHFLVSVDYSDPRKPLLSSDHPNLPGRLIGVAREGNILFTTGQRYDPGSGGVDPGWEVLHASAVDGDVVHLLDQLPFTQYGKPPEIRGTTIFQFQPQQPKIWVPSNEPPPVGDLIIGGPFDGVQLTLIGGSFSNASIRPTIIGASYWNPGTYEDNPRKSTLTTWELGANGRFARLDEVELAHESTFHLIGNLGIVYQRANQPRLLDLSAPSALRILGFVNFEGAPSLNYEFADGAPDRGLWIPTGQYGLEAVTFSP